MWEDFGVSHCNNCLFMHLIKQDDGEMMDAGWSQT